MQIPSEFPLTFIYAFMLCILKEASMLSPSLQVNLIEIL